MLFRSGPTSGFLDIRIRPDAGWAWTAIEFQLDSVIATNSILGVLNFRAWDQNNVAHLFAANFPWEANNGENQHYHFHADGGDVITKLDILYDPGTTGNLIHDIHNIDVASAAVPEPATLTMFGLGLLGVGVRLRRHS